MLRAAQTSAQRTMVPTPTQKIEQDMTTMRDATHTGSREASSGSSTWKSKPPNAARSKGTVAGFGHDAALNAAARCRYDGS